MSKANSYLSSPPAASLNRTLNDSVMTNILPQGELIITKFSSCLTTCKVSVRHLRGKTAAQLYLIKMWTSRLAYFGGKVQTGVYSYGCCSKDSLSMQLPVKVSKLGHCNVYLVTPLPLCRKGHLSQLAVFNTGAVQVTQRSLQNVTTGLPRYGALVSMAT